MKHEHLYYLASPYSHEDRDVMDERAEIVTKAAVDLLNLGVFVFAPIAYNSPWEKYNLPGNWGFWQDFDKAFVSRTDGVIVLTIDGWDKSVGVAAEIEFAREIGLPVYYLSLEEIQAGEVDRFKSLKKQSFCDMFKGLFEGTKL